MTASTFYHFEGDPEDETAWQAFVAAHSVATAKPVAPMSSSSTALKTLYELFLLFVVIVALAGTVLWQQDTAQIAALEAEVQTLEDELVNTAPRQETAAVSAATGARRPLVHHVIQTDYLRFVVATEHMALMGDIAPTLDTAYGDLSADLGLQVDPLAEKVNILLVHDNADADGNLYEELAVLVVETAGYAESIAGDPRFVAQEIYRDLYGRLVRRLLDSALLTREIRPSWGIVITHLDSNLRQSALPSSAATLPAYKVQQRALAQLVSLGTALLQREPNDWMAPDATLTHAVTDSVVEYILVTYGRDSIPQLLDAMSQYEDWDALIPAVFGIPVDQFTTEWHAYLQEHYPVEPVPPES